MNEKFDPFVAEWKSYATSPKNNLIEKCLKLSQLLEYPDLDISKYIETINDLGKSLELTTPNVENPTYRISLLNESLFKKHGFRGEVDDYYNPKNNFLNEVIEKKSGIPITLSILYAEVAKHIGLDLTIVGFPSHVIVKYYDEMILDPFNYGKLLSNEDLKTILIRNFGEEIELRREFLDEIKPEDILIRIKRNLKNSYAQSYAYDKALRCVNMILELRPDSPEEIRDKGILQERLLKYNDALPLLTKYLELEPNAEDVDFILDLIKSIREKINQ